MKYYAMNSADGVRQVGPNSFEPNDSLGEVPKGLVGKSIKILDGEVVLDASAEAQRLIDKEADSAYKQESEDAKKALKDKLKGNKNKNMNLKELTDLVLEIKDYLEL